MMEDWAKVQSIIHSGRTLGESQVVRFVSFASDDDWPFVRAECVARLGGEGFSYTPPYEPPSTGARDVAVTEHAISVCGIEYPSPQLRAQLRTPEQLEYEYAYYVHQLVPCLRTAGFAVTGVPSPTAFRTSGLHGIEAWSPYDSAISQTQPSAPLKMVRQKCPADPPGVSASLP
jgi:hypothetical protein